MLLSNNGQLNLKAKFKKAVNGLSLAFLILSFVSSVPLIAAWHVIGITGKISKDITINYPLTLAALTALAICLIIFVAKLIALSARNLPLKPFFRQMNPVLLAIYDVLLR